MGGKSPRYTSDRSLGGPQESFWSLWRIEKALIWGSIWYSETSVTIHRCYVTSQKSEDLIYIAAEAWSHAVKCLDCVNLEDGTGRLFRNVHCVTLEDGTNRLLPNVGKYQFTLCNIPEERRSHLHRGGNLKSQSLIYLFIGNLFTNAFSNSKWMPSSNWWRCMTNWKGCGRRLYLRYHPVIYLERLKKTTQNSQDSGVMVGIRSGYIPDTSQMYILFEPSCSATVFEKPTGPQVDKKIPAVYVKWYSLSFSQDARLYLVSWVNSSSSHMMSLSKLLSSFFAWVSQAFSSFRVSDKLCVCTDFVPSENNPNRSTLSVYSSIL